MSGGDAIDVWGAVRDERIALLADLERLTPGQWERQSLCTEWKVRDVVAHLVAGVEASTAALLLAFARSRFNVARMLRDDARRRSRGLTPDQLLAAYRSTVGSQHLPPGARPWQMLSDTMIHGQDIRRPLSLHREFPPGRVALVLDMLAPMDSTLGVRARIAGLRLRATDTDWSHGEGPEVAGPGEALLLSVTGRPAGLAELAGAGLPLLAQRVAGV